jgi:ribosomal protein L7Ae-like RNA K-turn-binding protein
VKYNNDKAGNMLGLAARAGKCVSGETSCEKAIRTRKAKLVILNSKASLNTKKKFQDMCSYRKIPLAYWNGDKDLGYYVGKSNRMVVVVIDERFSHMILKELDKSYSE